MKKAIIVAIACMFLTGCMEEPTAPTGERLPAVALSATYTEIEAWDRYMAACLARTSMVEYCAQIADSAVLHRRLRREAR